LSVLISIVLLLLYLVFRKAFSLFTPDNDIERDNDLDSLLEDHISSRSSRTQKVHIFLLVSRKIASALLIVGFSFFITGGIYTEFEPNSGGLCVSITEGELTVFLGWGLWALAIASIFLFEGADIILTGVSTYQKVPVFSRSEFITGRKARLRGIFRIVIGLSFIGMIVFAYLQINNLCQTI
jgi:hypothetical protein